MVKDQLSEHIKQSTIVEMWEGEERRISCKW